MVWVMRPFTARTKSGSSFWLDLRLMVIIASVLEKLATAHYSVFEVSEAGEDHGEIVIVGRLNHFSIAD